MSRSSMRTRVIVLLFFIGAVREGRAQGALQASVEGRVYDSLSRHPLEHATVQLVSVDSASRRITLSTAADGRFVAQRVPAGTYLIGFYHPRLDSLAIEFVPRPITVATERVTADLATPSAATVVTSLCRGMPSPATAVFGIVRAGDDGETLHGAAVTATWTGPGSGRELSYDELSMTDTSRADGTYVLCGVPLNAAISIVAAHGGDTTGTIFVHFDASHMAHRDLFVAHRAVGKVTGRLLNERDLPVSGRIALLDGSHETVTGSDGRFTMDSVPAGSQTLAARAIGFAPREVVATVAPRGTTELQVNLASAVLLPTVTTTAALNEAAVAAFRDAKRKAGAGYFVGAVAPPGYDPGTPAKNYAKGLPGVTTLPCKIGCAEDIIVMKSMTPDLNSTHPATGNYCYPEFRKRGPGDADDPRDIVGVEVYPRATEVPSRYNSRGKCGMIIFWTKKHIPKP